MSFFKLSDSNTLIEAPMFVCTPDYSLLAEEHESYTYPTDGWYWFDTPNAASAALIPKTVTRAQAKLAMYKLGMYDKISACMNDASTPTEYKIAWNDALTFAENSPILKAVCVLVGLSDDQLKQLFDLAYSLDSF